MVLEYLAPGARRRRHTAGTTEASLLGLLDVGNHRFRVLNGRAHVNLSLLANVPRFFAFAFWLIFACRISARRRFAGHSSELDGPVFGRFLQSRRSSATHRATWAGPYGAAGWGVRRGVGNETRGTCIPGGRSKVLRQRPVRGQAFRINMPPGSQTYAFEKRKAQISAARKSIAGGVGSWLSVSLRVREA
jgi:hypothetical protein